jgi:hypothetical protein
LALLPAPALLATLTGLLLSALAALLLTGLRLLTALTALLHLGAFTGLLAFAGLAVHVVALVALLAIPVLRVAHALVERVALLFEDLLQALLDVLEGRRQVEAVEVLSTLLSQLLQEVSQALGAVPHLVAHAALHEVAQGVLQVPEVHQVVRQRVQHVVGIERRDLLRAVPF